MDARIITVAEVQFPLFQNDDGMWEVRVASSGTLLFVTASPNKLAEQLHAYSAGLLAGMDAGRAAMQQEIREALGLV